MSRETEAEAKQLDRWCTLKKSVKLERIRNSLWVGAEAEAGENPEVPGAIPRTRGEHSNPIRVIVGFGRFKRIRPDESGL